MTVEKGEMKRMVERSMEMGGLPQLEEEKRLKEMHGEEEEEDNRTKISISNQPALKNPFCVTDCV